MSFTLWFTGLSGSGKSTLSSLTVELLRGHGLQAELLDGDHVRSLFMDGLGFSSSDRVHQIRQLGTTSFFLNKNGIISVVAAITPYASARKHNRTMLGDYLEVYCQCALDTLIARDPKGLYAKALQGQIQEFTGISAPYEKPENPDILLDTGRMDIPSCIQAITSTLSKRGIIPGAATVK